MDLRPIGKDVLLQICELNEIEVQDGATKKEIWSLVSALEDPVLPEDCDKAIVDFFNGEPKEQPKKEVKESVNLPTGVHRYEWWKLKLINGIHDKPKGVISRENFDPKTGKYTYDCYEKDKLKRVTTLTEGQAMQLNEQAMNTLDYFIKEDE